MEYYEPAGLLKRGIAFIIDYFISLVIFIVLTPDIFWLFMIVFYVWFIYIFIKDGLFNGQSIGKKILNLKVVDFKDHTKPCTMVQSIKRNVVLFLSFIIPFGEFVIAWQIYKNNRRWGDGFAGTIVVDLNKKSTEPIASTENDASVFGNEIWETKKKEKVNG